MKMQDNARLREILDQAAELPREQRAAFLDGACAGDQTLRAEVELLLASLDSAGGFLRDPTIAPDGLESRIFPDSPARERAGEKIGRYKLLQLIGEGGFGSVFMAEQQTPMVRKVALKIIKLGMDSAAIIARFEAERQALAMMDHPNIAKVLDAGTTESGRPYFVMELVQGIPINEYCDRKRLTPRQRIELFVPVCRAVQHAHQKGIIHRDLKPSNILVMNYDGQPVPKVIDFGVAKALNQRLTEKTLFTEFGHAVGTPEYMSPEQAEMDVIGADTRSDIYSLGALLYELLTGTTPLDRAKLREAGYAQMLRIIREEEPLKPSTRLTQSGDALASISIARGTDSRELTRLTAGDLDWIVMKCLEKDRGSRYETADGLARDLERYLRDEPVEASPPSASYRLRKLVRKHRREAIFVCAVTAALMLGIIGTSVGLARARHHLFAATEAQRNLRDQTYAANASAAKAQAAEQREVSQRKQAEAVADVLETIFHHLDPYAKENGGADLRTQLIAELDQIAANLDKQESGEPLVRARLFDSLGWTQVQLGNYAKGRTLLEKATAEQRKDGESLDSRKLLTMYHLGIAYRNMGESSRSIGILEQVRDQQTKLFGENSRDTFATQYELAKAYLDAGRDLDSDAMFAHVRDRQVKLLGQEDRETLRTRQALGQSYRFYGHAAQAVRLLETVRDEQMKRLGPDNLDTLGTSESLAMAYFQSGRAQDAVTLFEQVRDKKKRALSDDHPDVLNTLNDLAIAYGCVGRLDDEVKLLESVREMEVRKLGTDHPSTLTVTGNLAEAYAESGQNRKALEMERLVAEARERHFGPDNPNTLISLRRLANRFISNGDTRSALSLVSRLRAALSRRARDEYTADIVMALVSAFTRLGRADEAIELYGKYEGDVLKTWDPQDVRRFGAANDLAFAYFYSGQEDKGIQMLENLRPGVAELGTESLVALDYQYNLVRAYQLSGRNEDAIKVGEQFRESMTKVLGADSDTRIGMMESLATAYRSSGRSSDAAQIFRELIPVWMKIKNAAVQASPEDARVLASRARLYARIGRFKEAADDFRKVIELKPDEEEAWLQYVPLLLQLGDVDGYHEWREKQFDRFSEVAPHARSLAKDFVMMPASKGDLERVARVVNLTLIKDPVDPWRLLAKGLTEYRLGHFDEACNWLEGVPPPGRPEEQASQFRYCMSRLCLAMAYFRGGHEQLGRETFNSAMALAQRLPNAGEDDLTERSFMDWIFCQTARREAQETIRDMKPTTTTEKPPVPPEEMAKWRWSEVRKLMTMRIAEISGQMESFPQADPRQPKLLAERAGLYNRLGDVDSARHDANALLQYSDIPSATRQLAAALLAYAGDFPGQQNACAQMLATHSQSTDPNDLERTAKNCLLLADNGNSDQKDLELLVDRALEVANSPQAYWWLCIAKALARYRNGDFHACVIWADRSAKAPHVPARNATGELLLAMAYARLRDFEQAKSIFARAEEQIAKDFPMPIEDGQENWCIYQVLRREAQPIIDASTR